MSRNPSTGRGSKTSKQAILLQQQQYQYSESLSQQQAQFSTCNPNSIQQKGSKQQEVVTSAEIVPLISGLEEFSNNYTLSNTSTPTVETKTKQQIERQAKKYLNELDSFEDIQARIAQNVSSAAASGISYAHIISNLGSRTPIDASHNDLSAWGDTYIDDFMSKPPPNNNNNNNYDKNSSHLESQQTSSQAQTDRQGRKRAASAILGQTNQTHSISTVASTSNHGLISQASTSRRKKQQHTSSSQNSNQIPAANLKASYNSVRESYATSVDSRSKREIQIEAPSPNIRLALAQQQYKQLQQQHHPSQSKPCERYLATEWSSINSTSTTPIELINTIATATDALLQSDHSRLLRRKANHTTTNDTTYLSQSISEAERIRRKSLNRIQANLNSHSQHFPHNFNSHNSHFEIEEFSSNNMQNNNLVDSSTSQNNPQINLVFDGPFAVLPLHHHSNYFQLLRQMRRKNGPISQTSVAVSLSKAEESDSNLDRSTIQQENVSNTLKSTQYYQQQNQYLESIGSSIGNINTASVTSSTVVSTATALASIASIRESQGSIGVSQSEQLGAQQQIQPQIPAARNAAESLSIIGFDSGISTDFESAQRWSSTSQQNFYRRSRSNSAQRIYSKMKRRQFQTNNVPAASVTESKQKQSSNQPSHFGSQHLPQTVGASKSLFSQYEQASAGYQQISKIILDQQSQSGGETHSSFGDKEHGNLNIFDIQQSQPQSSSTFMANEDLRNIFQEIMHKSAEEKSGLTCNSSSINITSNNNMSNFPTCSKRNTSSQHSVNSLNQLSKEKIKQIIKQKATLAGQSETQSLLPLTPTAVGVSLKLNPQISQHPNFNNASNPRRQILADIGKQQQQNTAAGSSSSNSSTTVNLSKFCDEGILMSGSVGSKYLLAKDSVWTSTSSNMQQQSLKLSFKTEETQQKPSISRPPSRGTKQMNQIQNNEKSTSSCTSQPACNNKENVYKSSSHVRVVSPFQRNSVQQQQILKFTPRTVGLSAI